MASLIKPKYLRRWPWLVVDNHSVREDINTNIEILFERKRNDPSWRQEFMQYAHLIPLGILLLDLLINKIKIKLGHAWFNLAFLVCFFLNTMMGQRKFKKPMLIDNLNWFCDYNMAYLYDVKTN
jgi:hypothetical protein